MTFDFTPSNFRDPKLPHGLNVIDVPVVEATEETLKGFGKLISSRDELQVGKGFEIKKWPVSGWRSLDPGTGDEAGTTEGDFTVEWDGDYFMAKNHAIATENNTYLDGLAAKPEDAKRGSVLGPSDGDQNIYLWMSDYHPDGGQLFWPSSPVPFTVCLALPACGDDVKPSDMRAFNVPTGKGLYIHPGTWHNGIYVRREHCPATFLTRQGRVHARVSASWAEEFSCLLKVPLL